MRNAASLRRLSLYGLILLALSLVSVVLVVIVGGDPPISEDDYFPEPVIPNFEKTPNFKFPEHLRTTDLSLNRFIDRFARICMQAKYSEFRLMHTRKMEPLTPQRFESMFNALKEIRVVRLDKAPATPEQPGPVWVLEAQYDLESYADPQKERNRSVSVAIMRENDEWRLGPIPSEVLQRLRASTQPATTTAESSGTADARPAPEQSAAVPADPDTPSISANRRLSIPP